MVLLTSDLPNVNIAQHLSLHSNAKIPQNQQKTSPSTDSAHASLRVNHFENIHGLYLKSKHQQDRILVLHDLLDYVSKNSNDGMKVFWGFFNWSHVVYQLKVIQVNLI